jgi:hypothetical protein
MWPIQSFNAVVTQALNPVNPVTPISRIIQALSLFSQANHPVLKNSEFDDSSYCQSLLSQDNQSLPCRYQFLISGNPVHFSPGIPLRRDLEISQFCAVV